MVLKNRIKIRAPYKGKSSYSFWNNLGPGDIVEVEYSIKVHWGREKPWIKFTNTNNGLVFGCGSGKAANYIDKLEYSELD